MTWLSRFLGGQDASSRGLTARQAQSIAGWRHLPEPDPHRSHYRCRYVVVDVAATGSDVNVDRLRSIGAVAVVDGQIDFKDALQLAVADLAPARASPPAAGEEEGGRTATVDALIAFLGFVGKGPLVAYNAPFVERMIERALDESLGIRLGLQWMDLAWVLPDLWRQVDAGQGRLDAWLDHFGIDSMQRHDALSDAFATAQLLQVTLAQALRKGFETSASLAALEKARRHMHQSG